MTLKEALRISRILEKKGFRFTDKVKKKIKMKISKDDLKFCAICFALGVTQGLIRWFMER